MNFLFDVDGTLTPSRGTMDSDFKAWFLKFMNQYSVSLVTGSDIDKTIEQVGEDIVHRVNYSFNCSGNAIYQQGQLIHQSDWQCPTDLWLWLENKLYESEYRHRCGRHFEQRIGMLNFSIVGRKALGQDRTAYYEWDKTAKEREHIASEINRRWPLIQAAVGGETGIDIFARGTDKSQVIKYLNKDVVFIGDRMDPIGNDHTLAQAIIDKCLGKCYNVPSWTDTWTILRELCPNV